jgi:hypothetical protein
VLPQLLLVLQQQAARGGQAPRDHHVVKAQLPVDDAARVQGLHAQRDVQQQVAQQRHARLTQRQQLSRAAPCWRLRRQRQRCRGRPRLQPARG